MFAEDLLIDAINSNLANVLGNLVNRVIGMVNKYFSGIVENKNVLEEIDIKFKEDILGLHDAIERDFENLRIADSLEKVIDAYRKCNKYIDDTTPWVLWAFAMISVKFLKIPLGNQSTSLVKVMMPGLIGEV